MTSIPRVASPLRYPATPENIDQKILEPSPAFRTEVKKVLGTIVLFIVTYIVLVIAAGILAVACGYGGFMVIASFPKLITIIFGVGLVGLGIMVLIFLFKFLFKTNKTDLTHLTEITAKDQPQLFEFIATLAKETQTPLPKHIYLSADVNACVFYDSSFWSMFFPVRKNLQIGLGLVNCVNVSEFKAIIAHEFGHFSQRSMKLGSYVYNVNHVIYNMLFDNDGYANTLDSWGNAHYIFALFARITVGIVRGIQWILQGLYSIINKQYMALSREMEFHADAVAASVSGSAPLITSLQRLDVANMCYDTVLNYYNRWYRENKKGDNLYPAHTEVMKFFAEAHGLNVNNGIVQITGDAFGQHRKTRVVVKDQWASHPSTDDREAHLKKLNIIAPIETESAWALFNHPEVLQQKITDSLYSTLTFTETPERIDFQEFHKRYHDEMERYKLDKRYKGFYDRRNITSFDPDVVSKEPSRYNSLEEILNVDNIGLPDQIVGIETDLESLQNIQQKESGIKVFEFNGKKCKRLESFGIEERLKKELEATKGALEKVDQEIFLFLQKKAQQQGKEETFLADYRKMFELNKATETSLKEIQELMAPLTPIYQGNVTEESAEAITSTLQRHEVMLKDKMKAILEDSEFATLYTPEDKKTLEAYIQQKGHYFSKHSGFNNDAFTSFNEAINVYGGLLADKQFEVKKQLLTNQLSLL